ncbi:hypothetical protein [Yoonia sp.]|uniref:hypothetical protein n=1 Tax=Yoonia sp. TaxID=2212373 RepID=UPI002E09D093|nr:hypothetical protein [Yoonia sp.]
MEIPLSFPAPAAATAVGPILPRAITTKVQAIEPTDPSATLPDNKHYVAQVVTARLSGAEYPDNPSEIAPPERTLRPYDVPMLPYESESATNPPTAADATTASDDRDETTA